MKKHKVFCYGTLQEPSVQLDLIGRVVNGPLTSIEGFIVVRDYIDPEDNVAYPRMIAYPKGAVYGRVLEFTEEEISILDAYETAMYRREEMQTSNNARVEVYVPTYKEGTFKIKYQ